MFERTQGDEMRNLFIKIIYVSILTSIFAGCIQQAPTGNITTPVPIASIPQELRLATTTSTCDTGLLDVLNKKFEETNNIKY